MLSIIVNISKNNVIGCDKDLIFNIKEDLQRFKKITSHTTVIMGRKTFESLPFVLPNRHHIILTTDKNYKAPQSKEQIDIVQDINEIIEKYENSPEEVFVIGGGVVYNALLPYTKKLYITHVDKEVEGDTFFPDLNLNNYEIVNRSENIFSETEQCNFYYCDYLLRNK